MRDQVLRFAGAAIVAAAALASPGMAAASPFVLTVGSGDGQVTVGVDGYGAFGSAVGSDSTNAVFNPPGVVGASGTTFDSGVAIRFGDAGGRTFLTSGAIGGSGGLTTVAVNGTSTVATSVFTFGTLSFTLTQTLTQLTDGVNDIGALLEQTYSITNTGQTSVAFELVRYFDGDLLFNGSLTDGGGRLSGPETLFETDSATGAVDPTTFVGIRATGGTTPATNRYEIDGFSGLRSRIISGTALDDSIANDGGDADQFIDAGFGYDVTLALRNLFTLGAGANAAYTTTTIFGSGRPDEVPTPGTVPEPGTLVLLGSGILWFAHRARRTR
jgi:hypothetical protein